MSTIATPLDLRTIELVVMEYTAEHVGVPRHRVRLDSRFGQDLDLDSLDTVELLMRLEERFHVTLPDDAAHPSFKAVFTRRPFRVRDLVELVYLQSGAGKPHRGWLTKRADVAVGNVVPFTQLATSFDAATTSLDVLLEPLPDGQFRRRTDGMRCVRIPGAEVEIGCAAGGCADERPVHRVELDEFVIDAEPVSTTAYARFLNAIGPVDDATLRDWFVLGPDDHRREHLLLTSSGDHWSPRRGAETWPMMLVSWHGANAYAAWANRGDWRQHSSDADGECWLPSEAQWEYAARGPNARNYPWGDEFDPARAHVGVHTPAARYTLEKLPLLGVHVATGLSPFGLHHAVGNIWHWCRDSYDPGFYEKPEARRRNRVNIAPTGIKSERGGSWVGNAGLARCSYRRGRIPLARGRCLGFRCISNTSGLGV